MAINIGDNPLNNFSKITLGGVFGRPALFYVDANARISVSWSAENYEWYNTTTKNHFLCRESSPIIFEEFNSQNPIFYFDQDNFVSSVWLKDRDNWINTRLNTTMQVNKGSALAIAKFDTHFSIFFQGVDEQVYALTFDSNLKTFVLSSSFGACSTASPISFGSVPGSATYQVAFWDSQDQLNMLVWNVSRRIWEKQIFVPSIVARSNSPIVINDSFWDAGLFYINLENKICSLKYLDNESNVLFSSQPEIALDSVLYLTTKYKRYNFLYINNQNRLEGLHYDGQMGFLSNTYNDRDVLINTSMVYTSFDGFPYTAPEGTIVIPYWPSLFYKDAYNNIVYNKVMM